MLSRYLKARSLAACITAALVAGGMGSDISYADQVRISDGPARATAPQLERYIVGFAEPPAALHNRVMTSTRAKSLGANASNVGLIPNRLHPNGRQRIDMQSSEAKAYVAEIDAKQDTHLKNIRAALGRDVKVFTRMRVATNAAVLQISRAEAAKIGKLPGVVSITRDRLVKKMDDVSSRFIGASSIWAGAPDNTTEYTFPTIEDLFGVLNTDVGFKGDGITIGDIDTGYNSKSPSFAATDASGYTIKNPKGSGNFLGNCTTANISLGGCNDKVIGVYDEYSRVLLGKEDGVSVEDVDSHGSHTSSTMVGNARNAVLVPGFGFSANISGIAPHANLEFFAICPNGKGCYSSTYTQSLEDALNDGEVDAINLSFGSGQGIEGDYWIDPSAQAFLSAETQGIFVAQSAGNTQASGALATQDPGTVGNNLPWIATVAATTDTGAIVPWSVGLEDGKQYNAAELAADTPLSSPLPASTPIVVSPEFHASDKSGTDGCSGYPDGIFANAIAVVSRGTCAFGAKVAAAAAAGAIAVVISDNRPEPLGALNPTAADPGDPAYPDLPAQAVIPAFFIVQNDGAALAASVTSQSVASIDLATQRLPQQPDVLANFSLIGPVSTVRDGLGTLDLIKPDIAAPGVDILAAFNNATQDNDGNVVEGDNPGVIGFDSGTSMASPHVTASGALLAGLHHDWTPSEIRSALMMTAVQRGVTKSDGVTPADAFDVGAGRVQVYQASKAGLVLDETYDNFIAANPDTGGDPSTLNLASIQSSKCVNTCTFTRTFTPTVAGKWVALVSGELASKMTLSPSVFNATPGSPVTLTINVDAHQIPLNSGFHFGQVSLSNSGSPALHLPVAISVPSAQLKASNNVVNIDLGGKTSGSGSLTLNNPGAGVMIFQSKADGSTQPFSVLNQLSSNNNYQYSTHHTDLVSTDTDWYAAQSFVVSGQSVNLTGIAAPGAYVNGDPSNPAASLADLGDSLPLHWRIYTDANGVPSSDPAANGAAAWSYDATAGSTGVSVAGGTISLDLVAAQQNTALPAGKYWLVVYVDLPCDASGDYCTQQWAWFNSWTGNGTDPALLAPQYQATPGGTDLKHWTDQDQAFPGQGKGLALNLTAAATCDTLPAGLSVTPKSGAVGGAESATVTYTANYSGAAAASLPAPGTTSTAYTCLQTSLQTGLGLIVPRSIIPVQVNVNN